MTETPTNKTPFRKTHPPDQHLAVHDAKLGIRLDAPEYSFDQEITALIFVEAGSAYSSLRRGPAHFLNTAASLSVLVKG